MKLDLNLRKILGGDIGDFANTAGEMMAVTEIFSPHRLIDMFSHNSDAAVLYRHHANTVRDNAYGQKSSVAEPFPRDMTVCIWLNVTFGPTAWRVIDRGIAGRLVAALTGSYHNDYHTIVTATLREIEDLYALKPVIDIYGRVMGLLLKGLAPTMYGVQGTAVARKEIRRAYMEVPVEVKPYHNRIAKILTESGWPDAEHYAKASCINIYDLGKSRNKFVRFQFLDAPEIELALMALVVVDPSVSPGGRLEDFVDYARLNVLRRWVRDMVRWMDTCGVYLPFGSDEDNYQKLLPQLPAFWRSEQWDSDLFTIFGLLSISQPSAPTRSWTDEVQYTNYNYRSSKGLLH